MDKHLFFVTSPLHQIIVKQIIKNEEKSEIDIITTKEFKQEFDNFDPYIFYSFGTNKNILFKFFYLIVNSTLKINKEYKNVYIPNDVNIFIQIILGKLKYDKLIYFDDGSTALYRLQGKKSNRKLLKKILNLEPTTQLLSSKKIEKAYVLFPDILKKFRSDIEYINLKLILEDINMDYSFEIDDKYLYPDFMIFTQPLTGDNHCSNNEEIKVIKSFLDDNANKKIVIKVHPREKTRRYDRFKSYDNVFIFPSKFKNTPYQVLHNTIKPKAIVTFFSSILFSVNSLDENFRRISLVKRLKSNNNLFHDLKKLKDYFYDLEFY